MPRKLRRRPFGSITTVTRGKHVIRWTQDTPQGRKRLSKTVYGSFRDADAELAAIRSATDASASPTVGKVHDELWWPAVMRRVESGKLKRKSADMYARVWVVHVAPRWAHVPLSEVRRIDVQDWLLGITQGDGKLSIVVLRGIMVEAVRMELIGSSNLTGVTFEFGGKSMERSKAVYTLAEAESMLSRLRGSQCEAAYILACFGGMRTGESLGAMCAEVYEVMADGMRFAAVPVSRQMPESGSTPEEWTKTAQSRRTALVPDPYASRLMEIRAGRMADGIEWLSHREDGLPMSKGMLDWAWGRDAGESRIPFANLRPSWRTFAEFEWGVPSDTLEVLMGHALPGVSGRHYIRPDVDALALSMARAMRERGY